MSYRKWMKKWQVVIFWAIAIAFLGGVIWWSVGLYVSSRRKGMRISPGVAVAYLTKEGTAVNDPEVWILPDELDNRYSWYKYMHMMRYRSQVDPFFDEPLYKAIAIRDLMMEKVLLYYAKQEGLKVDKKKLSEKLDEVRKNIESNKDYLDYVKKKYRSVDRYITSIKRDVEINLLIQTVRDRVAGVSEEEMREYYDKHSEDIRKKYSRVDVKMVTTTEEATINKFMELSKKEGFEQAATDLSLSPFDYSVTYSFNEDVMKQLESASSGDILGPFKHGISWLAVKVKGINKVESYEDFVASKGYEDEKRSVENEKFRKWYEDYIKKEGLSFAFNDEELKYWFEYVQDQSNESKLFALKKYLQDRLFPGGEFDEGVPDLMKSLYVVLLEWEENKLREYKTFLAQEKLGDEDKKKLQDLEKLLGKLNKEEVKKLIDEVTSQEKAVVKNLYPIGTSSYGVLSRAVRFFPDDPQVVYDYYNYLYSQVKPMIPYAKQDMQTMYMLAQIQMGFYSVYYSDKASSDIKFDAIYNVYEMSKLLGEATSASQVLAEMQKQFPDKLTYDVEWQELEDMMSASATPATP